MSGSGWQWRSGLFAVTVIMTDNLLLHRVLADSVPWPALLPMAARSVLFLFGLLLVGVGAHVGWWTVCHYWQQRRRRQQLRG